VAIVDEIDDLFGVVQEFFGEPITTSIARIALNMPTDQCVELADRIQGCATRIRARLIGGDFADYRIHESLSKTHERTLPADSPALKAMALYFERSVVVDPIFEWAEALLAGPGDSDSGESAARLAVHVRNLVRLRPLVGYRGDPTRTFVSQLRVRGNLGP
jgi:hypothetical protein